MNKKIIKFFIALLLISIISIYPYLFTENTNDYLFRIQKGESATSITKRLKENNIINSSFLFKIIIKITNSEKQLTSGLFRFKPQSSLFTIIDIIKNNKVELKKITLPEGLTSFQIFEQLQNNGLGKISQFNKIIQDSIFIKSLTKSYSNKIEGFLYPETYFFDENITEKEILTAITKRFFDIIPKQFLTDNFYDVLKLASIVEGEAVHTDEKNKIASVYLNRLKRNQKLEADPTVTYLLKLQKKKRTKIYYKDLQIKSPYNTYRVKGLPPTPICNPSLSSINAVKYPKSTNFYYFFAGKDGYHIFSKTFKQHKNKLKLKKRKK